MKKYTIRGLCAKLCAAVTSAALLSGLILLPAQQTLAAPPRIPPATSGDFAAVPMTATISAQPNVLFILDNSNSMDEDVAGNAVDSDNPLSRSEIARNAIKAVINRNKDNMRFGLMAYDQQQPNNQNASAIEPADLSNSFYYCSYNPKSYHPELTVTPDIQRDPLLNTKRYHIDPNDPASPYIYYDIALPMYGTPPSANGKVPWFCYSGNYTEDNNSMNDTYQCYSQKTGTLQTPPPPPAITPAAYGYAGTLLYNGIFVPTDDDTAQGFYQFGHENASVYVGPAWFIHTETYPIGGGRLHVNIDNSTTPHIAELTAKLGTSQFVNPVDTPLRNAGNTPMAGTLAAAWQYFSGNLATPATTGLAVKNPITAPCQKNFIVLVTDGLPSANAKGVAGKAADLLPEVRKQIELLHSVNNGGALFDVRTFIVGFAMPAESGNQLDALAVAGGTADVNGHAYLANDPEQLASQLQTIFQQISQDAASGTSAAVNTNSRSGEGGVFPTMFYPQMQDSAGRTIYWAGDIAALFMDQYGRLREDSNGNHILDDTGDNPDKIVTYQQAGGSTVGFATPVGALTEKSALTMLAASALVGKYFYINSTNARHYYVCFNINNTVVADSDINTPGSVYRQRLEVTLATTDNAAAVAQKTARVLANSMIFRATAKDNVLTIETVLPGNVEDMSAGNSRIAFAITQQGSEPSGANQSLGVRTQVKYLWSASDWLASIDPADIPVQRAYNSPDKKRYIITFVDSNQNGIANSDASMTPFTATTDGTGPLTALIPVSENTSGPITITGVPAGAVVKDDIPQLAKRVINFIRGQDQEPGTLVGGTTLPAFRSRQIEYKNQVHTWRLGDIIHSNPLVVDRPNQGYKSIYGDNSYTAFTTKYANRRTVVYVGGNDGMLHAFNGGFYENRYSADVNNPTTGTPVMQYLTQPKKVDERTGAVTTDSSFTQYDLGAELWAYVPYNLLGHLYWLTEGANGANLQVNHVYYVDLAPVAYDVQMFPNDEDHPNGWGTILVGGMGFGGGRIDACADRDWNTGGTCKNTQAMSSAYFIFDITNPEKEPKLLAEFALPHQGFTTDIPALAYFKDKNNPSSASQAFLVFGSGPASADGYADSTALHTVRSSQNARLFYLRLPSPGQSLSSASSWGLPGGTPEQCRTDSGQECSMQIIGGNPAYVSDMVGVDTDLDYKLDVFYYGTVISQNDGSLSGALRRVVTNASAYPSGSSYDTIPSSWTTDSVLIDLAAAGLKQPISAAVDTAFDASGNLFVYFGTGRYLTGADQSNNDQQALYGIKEPRDSNTFTWRTVGYGDLYDATNVTISDADQNGVEVTGGTGLNNSNNSWLKFVTYMDNYSGWVHKLRTSAELAAAGITGTAERAVNQPVIFNQLFLATTFVPTNDACDNLGRGYLYALYYRTGTAAMTQDGPMTSRYDLGNGMPTGLILNGNGALVSNSGGNSSYTPFNKPPTGGELPGGARRLNWEIINE